VVYGYAENTPYYMPKEYVTAYQTLEKLQGIPDLKPDAKVLVDGSTIMVSTSHAESLTLEALRARVKAVLGEDVIVNPAGTFTLYGSKADTGVTGRKIVVDAYGSGIPVGGGAYSGKDLTKLDRVAAYRAREIAVELVKTYNLDKCLVELSYMIGATTPQIKVYANGAYNPLLSGSISLETCTPKALYQKYTNLDVTTLTFCPYMQLC
jgi:S-adenosylmethionine synthetase